MRAGLAFFLGAWAGWVVAAAISVHLLGQLVRPYNASASFSILAFTSVVPSLLVGAAGWLGARGSSPPLGTLALPALGMVLVTAILFFVTGAFASLPALSMAVVWVGLPALAWYWSHRLAEGVPKRDLPQP